MPGLSALQQAVRKAIECGALPTRLPPKWLGGCATLSGDCAACGAPIKQGDVELELECTRDSSDRPTSYRLHSQCFKIFLTELDRKPARIQDATSAEENRQG